MTESLRPTPALFDQEQEPSSQLRVTLEQLRQCAAYGSALRSICSNSLRMISGPVVLVGTHDAVIALQTDAQMVCRFTPFEVPRWQESDAFRRLLAAFERVLPLRLPSELAQREIAQYVLATRGGLTGEISRIINAAAELAIRSGHEAIRIEHLKDVTSTSAG